MSSKKYSQTFSRSVSLYQGSIPPQSFTLEWTETMSGVSLPGYRRLIKLGSDATTPYTAVKRKIDNVTGEFSWRHKGYGGPTARTDSVSGTAVFPSFFVPLPPSTSEKKSADNIARSNFASDVQSAFSKVQGQVEAAEFGKTSGMITGRIKSLLSGFSNYVRDAQKLRRMYQRSPKKAAKALNDLYLEYTYGWSPLIGSIQAVMEEANRKPRPTQGVSGIGTFTSSSSSAFNQPTFNSNLLVGVTQSDVMSYSVRYKGEVIANIPTLSPVAFGLTLEEFIPTAWELCPWSFVVDYLSNVGDWLTAFSYSNVGFRYIYSNSKLIGERKVGYKAIPGSYAEFQTGSGSWVTTYEVTTRSKADPILPNVDLQLQMPNWKQLTNIASLIAARLL